MGPLGNFYDVNLTPPPPPHLLAAPLNDEIVRVGHNTFYYAKQLLLLGMVKMSTG
jgi:hypothetical protein